MFCGGVGLSGIGQSSPTDNNFLWMHGDGGAELGAPSTLMFPTSARDVKQVSCMTEDQFKQKLVKKGGNTYSWPLITKANVSTTQDIMSIAPIPSFLVYDGVNKDLNAAELLECITSIPNNTTPALTHATLFTSMSFNT